MSNDATIKIANVTRTHISNPSKEEIAELVKAYDLHELVEEDLLELNTQDKIDVYDDQIVVVLHFPKMNLSTNSYVLNEFNIVLGKDYIISVTRFATNHISNLRRDFVEELHEYQKNDELYKITPYYMLYEILDLMYNKLSRMLVKVAKDSIELEEDIFHHRYNSSVISNLLIKKRNLSFIKHNFVTQKDILVELSNTLPSFYEEELEVYFDDLISKHSRILHMVDDQTENINSLADTYNSLMSIKMNDTILLLTIVTIILGTMTLVAGLYGMNVKLPYDTHPYAFTGIMVFLVLFAVVQYFLLKRIINGKRNKR